MSDAPTTGRQTRADNALLAEVGQIVRTARAKRGMTRKALAQQSGTSERYLAQIETGEGNPSVLVLDALARALDLDLFDLLPLGDQTHARRRAVTMLRALEDADVAETLRALERNDAAATRGRRIALIGLRGAGKSTLGQRLAEDLGFPFVELSREIEKFAGCSISEIQALYGQNAYRRYERRALEEAIQIYDEAVIATPGGIVSDVATFNLLLAHCTTVWLQADPEDHMKRVIAQGDMRPMAASSEAMADLKSILAGRAAFYSKAELHVDTSARSLEETFRELRHVVREALRMPS